jgi:hypothetical protein
MGEEIKEEKCACGGSFKAKISAPRISKFDGLRVPGYERRPGKEHLPTLGQMADADGRAWV